MPDKNKPGRGVLPAPGRKTEYQSNINSLSHHHHASSGRRRTPPYARHLVPDRSTTLAIVTGSDGWRKAASSTWFQDRKLLLPFRTDPTEFDWSPAGGFADVVIFSVGVAEPIEVITELATCLLGFVSAVLYSAGGRVILFSGGDDD